MILRYGFIDRGGREFSAADVSISDFKFWFRLVKWDLKFGYVILDNGSKYIYYSRKYRGFVWEKVR